MSKTEGKLAKIVAELRALRSAPHGVATAAQKLDALSDDIEWIEKGLAEWRAEALEKARHLTAVQATARVAIGHLQAVLNKARTHAEQQAADTAARDWLASIGSEPD